MNSQELEQSLKAEFESHLNTVIAEMKQELAAFQGAIQSDLEQQRSRMDEAFKGFSQRIESRSGLGGGFNELVAEHLKLARDEGARLAATAYSEAEMIGGQSHGAPAQTITVPADYAGLRNAVSEISKQDSQASILTSLVEHAAKFAARGAFFIVKNERFMGWKTFGDAGTGENTIRDVSLAIADNSILGKASRSTQSVDSSYGAHEADIAFINPLQFGEPRSMFAIPLVVRGRSVAVLYADGGAAGTAPNREALEMLLRVSGMTVELLAAGLTPTAEQATAHAPAASQPEDVAQAEASFEHHEPETVAMEGGPQYSEEVQDRGSHVESVPSEQEPAHYEAPAEHETAGSHSVEADSHQAEYHTEQPAYVEESRPETQPGNQDSAEPVYEEEPPPAYQETVEPSFQEAAVEEAPAFFQEPVADTRQEEIHDEQPQYQPEPEPTPVYETSSFDLPAQVENAPEPAIQSPFERTVAPFEPAAPIGASVGAHVMDQAVEVTSPPMPRGRLSDRQVDLPIEVPEEDRRMHNDARRFARLLVSEIKLYNEKKVLEGRQAADLYGRLKEAIDRSREMYDKRVQPPVAAKFDYFHYELVNSLAEGDAAKFGSGYPGSAV